MLESIEEYEANSAVAQGQIVIGVALGLVGLVNSMSIGFSSPALPLLQLDPSIETSDEQTSWIASILPFGAIFGSVVSSILVDWTGRKFVLVCSVIIFALSWVQMAMSLGVTMIILARFIAGICIGLTTASSSVYAAETIQPRFRPMLLILMGIFGTSGIMLMAFLVKFLTWRGLSWAGMFVCIPTILFLFFLPESPYYLQKDSNEKAMKSFQWILVSELESRKKFDEMKKTLQNISSESNSDSMFNKVNIYPSFVLVTLHVIQQCTGINVFIFFATTIFMKISQPHAESLAMWMSSVNVLSNLIASYFIGNRKRIQLLRLSTRTVVPCLWIIALFFIMKDSGIFGVETPSVISFISCIAVMFFIFFFAFGWGPIPFMFLWEGLPSTVRGNATGISTALNWTTAFIVTKSFSLVSSYIGYGWVFFIYSLLTAIGGLFLERYMPETLGKSVNEMDIFYNTL